MRNTIPLIAHVVHRFDVGGLENGLVNLINRIPADRYRHAVVCLTEASDFKRRLERDVQLFSLHKRQGNDWHLYVRLWRLFRSLRPDIVHTRNLATLEAQLPALLAGVRCRIHGEHGRDIHDLDGGSRRYRWLRAAFRPMIDQFIPLSQELAAYLKEGVGVPRSSITTIINGVDTERFHPRPVGSARCRDILGPAGLVGERDIVIGTVGRMEVVKDQMTLARAFVALIERRPDLGERVRLVLIGDGSQRERIVGYLQASGCAHLAWMPGARDDIPELLRAMDIFVLPSLAEGISNTILEAMASGLPVVATNVGGNGELILDGVTGVLVPRDNPEALSQAMMPFIDNDEDRRGAGMRGRMRAEKEFSIENMVNSYLAAYDAVIRAKGVGRAKRRR